MSADLDASRCRVAVIGAGPQGLCMLKNLLEEGFDAVMYDSRAEIGGLWAYTDDANTYSVLKSTRLIISKLKNCYADFPCPDGADMFMGGKDFLRYLQDYAARFGLLERFVGGKRIETLTRCRTEEKDGWSMDMTDVISGQRIREFFDKVVVTVGRQHDSYMPHLDGMEKFGDRIMHSRGFKDPEQFRGRNILILGFASTTADIVEALLPVAKDIHVSHRRGILVFPRILNGKPIDQSANRRISTVIGWLSHWLPAWTMRFMNEQALKISDGAWKLDFAWRFRPAPDRLTQQVMVSDSFVPALQEGRITSCANISRIVDARTVELEDGTQLQVDNIICCTGLKPDDSLLEGHVDFGVVPSPAPAASAGNTADDAFNRIPRLYQNIFPPRYPDSLAFLDQWQIPTGVCDVADLIATAVTQVFLENYAMPSHREMETAIDEHHRWMYTVGMLPKEPRAARVTVREAKWRFWLNGAAGNGLNEYLGWSWKGLWFWMTNWSFCGLLMTGVDSPHVQRLFPGRRRQWAGARRAIEHVNAEYASWRQSQSKKVA